MMKIDLVEFQGLSKPVWEEGVVLKKTDSRNPVLLLELTGILAIPVLGFLVFIWEFSLFSFLLFLFTLLISYEIVLALRKRNIRVYREGLEVNEKIKMLQGGALCATTDEPAFISWDNVEGIEFYQQNSNIKEPSGRDTLHRMSTIASVLDEDHDAFFHLVTKDGGIYRGILRNEKSVKQLKNALKDIGLDDSVVNE